MTNYFIDHDFVDDEDTLNTYTFTNGSTDITVPGDQTAFWAVDDYIRSNDPTYGIEWYKITAVSYDDVNNVTTITVDHAFYQTSHTAGAQKNSQYRLWLVDSGASGNGQSPTAAFCHIQQFFDVAQAGDVGYVRRGKTYYFSNTKSPINDGTASAFITLMGDDGTGWPTETTLAKPIIDGQNKSIVLLNFSGDLFWILKEFKIQNVSTASYRNAIDQMHMGKIYTLEIDGTTITYGVGAFNIEIYDSDFGGAVLVCSRSIDNSKSKIENTVNLQIIPYYSSNSSIIICKNCSFTAYPDRNIIYALHCGLPDIDNTNSYAAEGHYEDGDAHVSIYYGGRVEKDTTNYTGSATSSLKCIPSSNIDGTEWTVLKAFEWKIPNVSGGVSHTVTVYVMGDLWTTFPTADELYIEVEYINDAVTGETATAKSTDILTANLTWTAFTVTFTPAADGDVYVRGYLKKYDTDATGNPCVIWFNGEVEIT